MNTFAVYILAHGGRGSLEVGVSMDLVHTIWTLRRQKTASVGTDLAFAERLVWFEEFDSAEAALKRERELHRWQRSWLFRLVEQENPLWLDLYPNLLL